jgi:DNA-binding transcriptional LysR family regulator
MNISQPAASRMIAEIEGILDAPICRRHPRGVVLTSYGRALARRARSMLEELAEAGREIADLKAGRGGSIFVGAVTGPGIALAVPAITAIRGRYPKIEVNVQIEASNVLARELLAARHDFIIARIPDDLNPRQFQARQIGTEHACIIVRKGHPLAGRGTVTLEDLRAYDWVLQPSGSLLRQTIEAMFLSHNVPLPERVLNTSSVLLTFVMVAQTDAVAPLAVEVAKFVMGAEGLAGAIEVLPISSEIVLQPYSLIQVRGRTLSPAAQMLYDAILEASL